MMSITRLENLEMKKSIDDFDDIQNSPAPECEKKMILNIYHLCIQFASFLNGGDTTMGQKKYLDLIFYCLCRINVCGVFMAIDPSDGSRMPHMYCLLLAPSLYLLREELNLTNFEKLREQDLKLKISYDPIEEQLFFLPSTAACFEELCLLYQVKSPLYELIDG